MVHEISHGANNRKGSHIGLSRVRTLSWCRYAHQMGDGVSQAPDERKMIALPEVIIHPQTLAFCPVRHAVDGGSSEVQPTARDTPVP